MRTEHCSKANRYRELCVLVYVVHGSIYYPRRPLDQSNQALIIATCSHSCTLRGAKPGARTMGIKAVPISVSLTSAAYLWATAPQGGIHSAHYQEVETVG